MTTLYRYNQATGKTEPIQINSDSSSDGGRFSGKNLLVVGDSIMALTGVPEKIATLSGMNVVNAAVGGTRAGWHVYEEYDALSFYKLADAIASGDFTVVLDKASFSNDKALKPMKRLSQVDFSTLDYMIVSYGTNDFTGGNNVEDSTDFTSFKHALEYGVNEILTAYPNVKIIFNSPIFRGDLGTAETGYSDGYVSNKTNLKLIDFVDSMIDVGEKMHIPVIDQYRGLAINKETFKHYLQLSEGDYVHPNKTVGCDLIASRIYGQMIANW